MISIIQNQLQSGKVLFSLVKDTDSCLCMYFQAEEAFSKYQQCLKYCESFANKTVCTEKWNSAHLLT